MSDKRIAIETRMPPEDTEVIGWFDRAGVAMTSWFQWPEMENPSWAPGISDWGRLTHWQRIVPPYAAPGKDQKIET